jgi:hypothetical protein
LPRQFRPVTNPEKIVAVFNQANSGFRVKQATSAPARNGQNALVYLEADKLANVRFYEKSGFITINHDQ